MTVGVRDSGCPHAFHRDVNRSHLSCQHPQNHIWVESLVWIGEGVPQCTPSADVKPGLAIGRRAAGGRHAATAGRCDHSSARTTEWASGAERWLSDPLAPAQTAQEPS